MRLLSLSTLTSFHHTCPSVWQHCIRLWCLGYEGKVEYTFLIWNFGDIFISKSIIVPTHLGAVHSRNMLTFLQTVHPSSSSPGPSHLSKQTKLEGSLMDLSAISPHEDTTRFTQTKMLLCYFWVFLKCGSCLLVKILKLFIFLFQLKNYHTSIPNFNA